MHRAVLHRILGLLPSQAWILVVSGLQAMAGGLRGGWVQIGLGYDSQGWDGLGQVGKEDKLRRVGMDLDRADGIG